MNESTEDSPRIEKLSIVDLANLFGKTRMRTLVSIFLFFVIALAVAFQVGALIEAKRAAITSKYPFKMTIDNISDLGNLEDGKIELEKIYLVKDPQRPIREDDRMDLVVRRMVDAGGSERIGSVVAKKVKPLNVLKFIGLQIEIPTFAQDQGPRRSPADFDWRGHESDTDFHEEYVDEDTIRRYYDDGWVLEYDVDQRGRTILSTFRWVTTQ